MYASNKIKNNKIRATMIAFDLWLGAWAEARWPSALSAKVNKRAHNCEIA